MSNDLMLDVGQTNDLKMAFRRAGWTPADIAKFCAGDCAARVLTVVRGEGVVSQPAHLWSEKDGVITFLVTSDGTTGEEWIERLERKGLRVSDYAKSVLRSKKFQPTSGVTTLIAVFKGSLFTDDDRITQKIRAEAKKRDFTTPNVEVACLIREMFSDAEIEAMGLWWIVTMHEPIKDSVGGSLLLSADRRDGGRWLGAYDDRPDPGWSQHDGFAFVVPQVP